MDHRPGTAPALISSSRARTALLKRLSAATSEINTATVTAMTQRHEWFGQLDPESRSWIGILARAGIDGFVTWFSGAEFKAETVFEAAPRAMARRISLQQTVDLVRTTTEVLEEQLQHLLPRGDRQPVQLGIVHYSREIAFAAAAIYARAAEARGAWDSRIEATIVDAVVRAETDESMLSRASTLGWNTESRVVVAIGGMAEDGSIDALRRAAAKLSLDVLAAPQGDRLVCIIGGAGVTEPVETCDRIAQLQEHFATGPIVVGPTAETLAGAPRSARAAASGYRAAKAWPEGPRTLLSVDLLPERALAGDGHARRVLASELYPALAAHKELLDTCVGFLDCGSSMEATARALFIHPNTVRYRLKRIQEVTGYNPADPREAYILRMAITLGRLHD
ncbi:PucR family transcriptional regulator [Tessaracoccus flavus]|uniref:PucR family transcriptional regulator n=1 Tax=Tessaracoccus flavus TaxID=1610493 RepID=A0A1Q2CDU9_9ACTN|nr:helix-turn-helix domain-containing protein [Tessaracoccus flavus]AQP44286.1 PucR family transcriptional regulator [Tessaracoccus flavus]SDY40682.1 DNA-binding transcriptional regulator, PucR family [Tessaracoccus flavus]